MCFSKISKFSNDSSTTVVRIVGGDIWVQETLGKIKMSSQEVPFVFFESFRIFDQIEMDFFGDQMNLLLTIPGPI